MFSTSSSSTTAFSQGCPEKNMITIWLGNSAHIFHNHLLTFHVKFFFIVLSTTPDKCSHVRAHHLYLESLTTNFTAVRCGSFHEIQSKLCWSTNNSLGLMGGDITPDTQNPHGSFYLETNGQPPYVIPDYRNFNHSLIFQLYNAL